ncbi:Tim10/DDP family zinc finger-domain-containing protein [Triangularia verruculosa]|uniref:Mitochondrial import inner membrane translocase subunit n=1 Tax=Triangularia verruculosa TaxID=2587418 RepID=A0AAN6XES0_9PEZI|nr:Tim10/DDP family zinc finger-domain-containing protein [Triangularia verruculosa]
MSSALNLDQADIERLNDSDKGELRQFFANEEQKSKIQSQSHALTSLCWKKCMTSSTFRSGALDNGEKACLANCVERFMDVNMATVRQLAGMGGRH